MKNLYRKDYRKVKLAEPRTERQEFGKGKKGLVICGECNAFYYQKSWHHNADAFIARRENKDMPVRVDLCPADTMIKNGQYEGKVVVRNIPAEQKKDLLNLIKGYCGRAFDRDPMHRLIGITQDGFETAATVTENQLAQKLARKIKDAFNTVKLSFARGKSPSDTVTVTVEFLEK